MLEPASIIENSYVVKYMFDFWKCDTIDCTVCSYFIRLTAAHKLPEYWADLYGLFQLLPRHAQDAQFLKIKLGGAASIRKTKNYLPRITNFSPFIILKYIHNKT